VMADSSMAMILRSSNDISIGSGIVVIVGHNLNATIRTT
jgi:hypothetical protein